MAKKRKKEIIVPGNANHTPVSQSGKLEELSDMAYGMMSEKEKAIFETMMNLALMGITPEEYTQFYRIFELSGTLAEQFTSDDDSGTNFFDHHHKTSAVKEYPPLSDATEHTLALKIQMKDVTKPPMWREVEIPASYTFLQLHETIQEVAGLHDCHLWQFNAQAYDDSLLIGLDGDNSDDWMEGLTHDAGETPLTQFLQCKGDKLEYVYDFGDDWIFTITVKDLLNKKSEYPVCTKFKSHLNAIEDFGGIYSYREARNDMEEWHKLSKSEQKKRARDRGFDSAGEYIDFLNENTICIDCVNDFLQSI